MSRSAPQPSIHSPAIPAFRHADLVRPPRRLAPIPAAQAGADSGGRRGGGHAGRGTDDGADPALCRPLWRQHGRGGQPRHRRLRQLQRLLHPRAQAGCETAGPGRPGLPGRRRDQPVRRHRRRPDLPGQRPPLQQRRAARRRCGVGGRIRRRPLRHALLEPARLPPHPHALRRAAAADGPCARRAVLGQPDHRARRAWAVCAQRAGGLRVRR